MGVLRVLTLLTVGTVCVLQEEAAAASPPHSENDGLKGDAGAVNGEGSQSAKGKLEDSDSDLVMDALAAIMAALSAEENADEEKDDEGHQIEEGSDAVSGTGEGPLGPTEEDAPLEEQQLASVKAGGSLRGAPGSEGPSGEGEGAPAEASEAGGEEQAESGSVEEADGSKDEKPDERRPVPAGPSPTVLADLQHQEEDGHEANDDPDGRIREPSLFSLPNSPDHAHATELPANINAAFKGAAPTAAPIEATEAPEAASAPAAIAAADNSSSQTQQQPRAPSSPLESHQGQHQHQQQQPQLEVMLLSSPEEEEDDASPEGAGAATAAAAAAAVEGSDQQLPIDQPVRSKAAMRGAAPEAREEGPPPPCLSHPLVSLPWGPQEGPGPRASLLEYIRAAPCSHTASPQVDCAASNDSSNMSAKTKGAVSQPEEAKEKQSKGEGSAPGPANIPPLSEGAAPTPKPEGPQKSSPTAPSTSPPSPGDGVTTTTTAGPAKSGVAPGAVLSAAVAVVSAALALLAMS
ncbi:hypothetical protein Esti_004549 [Eimeria stiedai]